jgi:hypothetical protein
MLGAPTSCVAVQTLELAQGWAPRLHTASSGAAVPPVLSPAAATIDAKPHGVLKMPAHPNRTLVKVLGASNYCAPHKKESRGQREPPVLPFPELRYSAPLPRYLLIYTLHLGQVARWYSWRCQFVWLYKEGRKAGPERSRRKACPRRAQSLRTESPLVRKKQHTEGVGSG